MPWHANGALTHKQNLFDDYNVNRSGGLLALGNYDNKTLSTPAGSVRAGRKSRRERSAMSLRQLKRPSRLHQTAPLRD
jgi:hypothetical protein